MSAQLTTAMIGIGQWGSNVLRCLARQPRCALKYICDSDSKALQAQAAQYPQPKPTDRYADVLADPAVQAVVIATHAPTHYDLARQAMEAGKHVFVEKPMALTAAESARLVELSRAADRRLMVGHLLRHHPAYDHLDAMIRSGAIGDIRYMYTQRLNLGVVRREENAWWSLAPHDVAVICGLFDAEPVSVSAVGQCYLQTGVEDVVFATLKFADGRMGHIHVSWLDPHKIRQMTIVGSKKMATWDDMSAGEKIRVYDKGADLPPVATFAEAITIRSGDIVIPRVSNEEPLARQMRRFIEAVLDGKPVLTDAADGLRVVRVLEAGQASLRAAGEGIEIEPAS